MTGNIIKALALITMFTFVLSLEPLTPENGDNVFSKVVMLLSNAPPVDRRTANAVTQKGKTKLMLRMKPKDKYKSLRNSDKSGEEIAQEQRAELVEEELKSSLASKLSALLDRPFVEQRGKNDYLVMRPDVMDPFVTVIPNDIYYNVEKKCVNWLDDCSLQGIRARLLRGVQSP